MDPARRSIVMTSLHSEQQQLFCRCLSSCSLLKCLQFHGGLLGRKGVKFEQFISVMNGAGWGAGPNSERSTVGISTSKFHRK